MARVAVIYYSSTGNVHQLAEAIAAGAEAAGAEVRLRRVRELAETATIARNPKWAAHVEATAHIPEATHEDLEWADAYVFGSPTRFANITAQLKLFLDQAGMLWAQGKLVDKVVSGFTSASTQHGGHESTLIALYNTFYNWGSIIVPPGYADPVQMKSGTPFGATSVGAPTETELAAATFQGRRVAEVTARLVAGRPPATA
ncbi:MAG: NAD(P)H:quinone oxidoreductase [Dehalococcoidia bacterium]|nr:NAD(P)H:quinone oxidoreductase [Dehalococcoidia bacterium]